MELSVIAVARGTGAGFDAAVDELRQAGQGSLHFRAADLADIAALPLLAKALRKEFGSVYGLVNNAGIGSSGLLANMGDIYADRERFARARTYWERMPGAQPGKPEAYLDTATVYWDYYR